MRLRGVGKSEIVRVYFWYGLTQVLVISNPANSTVCRANRNFSGFRVIPCRPQVSSYSWAWWKLSSMVEDHRSVSSMYFIFLLIGATISS